MAIGEGSVAHPVMPVGDRDHDGRVPCFLLYVVFTTTPESRSMADDPRDDLISGTVALDGEDAPRRPALPFGEQGRRHRAPVDDAAAPPVAPPAAHASDIASTPWPSPPAYAAPTAMPSAMPQIVARAVGMAPPGAPFLAPSAGPTPPAPIGGAYAFSNAAAGGVHERGAPDARAATPLRASRERIDYLWHAVASESAILCCASVADEATSAQEEEWLPDEGAEQIAAVRALLRKQPVTPLEDLVTRYEGALDRGERALHCLVRGDLVQTYDPIEALRVTLTVVPPHLVAPQGGDARVRDAHEAAREALRSPVALPPAVAASHRERLDEAMKAALRAGHAPLEAVVERALVEGRALARRRVFGRSFARAHLHPAGRTAGTASTSSTVPVYLTDDAAEALPLMARVAVRLVVEVRPAQDAAESHPLALRCVALARVVELGARGR